jgi:hypothetical protein
MRAFRFSRFLASTMLAISVLLVVPGCVSAPMSILTLYDDNPTNRGIQSVDRAVETWCAVLIAQELLVTDLERQLNDGDANTPATTSVAVPATGNELTSGAKRFKPIRSFAVYAKLKLINIDPKSRTHRPRTIAGNPNSAGEPSPDAETPPRAPIDGSPTSDLGHPIFLADTPTPPKSSADDRPPPVPVMPPLRDLPDLRRADGSFGPDVKRERDAFLAILKDNWIGRLMTLRQTVANRLERNRNRLNSTETLSWDERQRLLSDSPLIESQYQRATCVEILEVISTMQELFMTIDNWENTGSSRTETAAYAMLDAFSRLRSAAWRAERLIILCGTPSAR